MYSQPQQPRGVIGTLFNALFSVPSAPSSGAGGFTTTSGPSTLAGGYDYQTGTGPASAVPTSTVLTQNLGTLAVSLEGKMDDLYGKIKDLIRKMPNTFFNVFNNVINLYYRNPALFICFIIPTILFSLPPLLIFLCFTGFTLGAGLFVLSLIQGGIFLVAGTILFFSLCAVGITTAFLGSIGYVLFQGIQGGSTWLTRLMHGESVISPEMKGNLRELKKQTVDKVQDTGARIGGAVSSGVSTVTGGQPQSAQQYQPGAVGGSLSSFGGSTVATDRESQLQQQSLPQDRSSMESLPSQKFVGVTTPMEMPGGPAVDIYPAGRESPYGRRPSAPDQYEQYRRQ